MCESPQITRMYRQWRLQIELGGDRHEPTSKHTQTMN